MLLLLLLKPRPVLQSLCFSPPLPPLLLFPLLSLHPPLLLPSSSFTVNASCALCRLSHATFCSENCMQAVVGGGQGLGVRGPGAGGPGPRGQGAAERYRPRACAAPRSPRWSHPGGHRMGWGSREGWPLSRDNLQHRNQR